MRTFSHNGAEIFTVQARVYESIQRNLNLFKRTYKEDWPEAVSKAYVHAITHLKPPFARRIDPYIKNLAINIGKIKSKETPVLDSEEGEGMKNFTPLTTTIDNDLSVYDKEIQSELCKIYLLYKKDFDEFLKSYKEAPDDSRGKLKVNCSDKIKDAFSLLMESYGDSTFGKNLMAFMDTFDSINKKSRRGKGKVLDISLLPITEDLGTYFNMFSGVEAEGGFYGVNEDCTMSLVADYGGWKLPNKYKSTTPIYKIDISHYLSMIYNNVYIPEGVNTHLLEWFREIKCFISPGGSRLVDMNEDDFITYCLKELITNLIFSTECDIIAISPDSLFVVNAMNISKINCKTWDDLKYSLPVEEFKG